MIKKIGAAILAAMLLTMCMAAFATEATTTLDENGEQGAFTRADSPVSQDKVLVLEKELKVYNANETKVHAPTITYNYAITPAVVAEGTTVTDKSDKHQPAGTVTAPVKSGIGTLSATVSWSNEELDASSNGSPNMKYISINFGSVAFSGAGVYRYVITESLANDFTYNNTGVTETTATGNDNAAHKRYIDVYVKPADTFTGGSAPADWDIYGFTCFYNNETITDANKKTTAVKTTGFVDGTTDGTTSTEFLADQYYTYNLTISKTVSGDNYAKATHEFPFTVIFTNEEIEKDILLKTTETGTVDDFDHAKGAPTWSGIAKLKDSGSIKYIGIPVGTDVEVYETNDMSGTTYKVTTTRTNATTQTATDAMVVAGSTPTSAEPQEATKANDQSTKSVIDTTINTKDANDHAIAITNTLVTISPTGVVLRIAPYVMILAAGIFLLLISRRRKAAED